MSNREVWQRKEQLAVKTPGTAQSRIDVVDAIGGADDVDLATVVDAVHLT